METSAYSVIWVSESAILFIFNAGLSKIHCSSASPAWSAAMAAKSIAEDVTVEMLREKASAGALSALQGCPKVAAA